MIHERLYQSEHFESIDFRGYAEALLEELFMSFHVGDRIKSELNIQRFYLGLDTAIPCGLIINELVTNSIKHAFPNDGGGRIRVEFRLRDGDHYELVVSDNGVGMPEGINIHEIDTLGLKLIDVLSQQLNGKFEISGKKGTCCTVSFMR
jgi:two-component sensor histidine kinase